MSATRSTDEVFHDHLELRARGEVELDIERNYDPAITLIREGRIYRGHDGVRECARALKEHIGNAKASYDTAIVDGDVAFLKWSVHSDGVVVEDGVDTFVIRKGRIVSKTMHYTISGRPDKPVPSAEPGRLSSWRDSKGIDEKQAREHAARLELRARAEDEIAVRNEYVRLLGVAPGERVLEVGCGSGAVTRTLAQRVSPDGQVVGVDASAALLKIARGLADDVGLGQVIDFKEGDCRALSFPDSSFDAVLAVTTLSHVPNVERALAEMVRVVRPGGRVAVFDIDGDSFLISHPDRERTRRIAAAFCDHGLVNGWLMRSLAGVLRQLGVGNVRTQGFMPLDTGGYYARAAVSAADIAFEAGVITSDERADWLEALRAQFAGDRFVAGRLHLFVWGTRDIV